MASRALDLALISLTMILSACQPPAAQTTLGRLNAPDGFKIEVWAEVPGARSLAVAEDGAKVFVGTRDSTLYAVLDPERDGEANEVITVADGLLVPNGVALADDGGLFVVEQDRITRYDVGGDVDTIVPPGVLPNHRAHGWRYAGFGPDGKLYVSVGAPCNVCELSGFEGTIIRMKPDGHDLEVFARGVRNSVGFDWHPATGEMFFADNGADQMGDLIPPDEFNHAPKRDLHFGFPYRYAADAAYPQLPDLELPEQELTHPAVAFEAHAAALGVHFYRGSMFPDAYRHDALVAQHGSWNRSDPVGYRVMRVRFDDQGRPAGKEVFIDGWQRDDGEVEGRVVDLAELPDGSLLISDDHADVIYRVTYRQ